MAEYILISGFITLVVVVCIMATANNTAKTNTYLKAILEELRKRPL